MQEEGDQIFTSWKLARTGRSSNVLANISQNLQINCKKMKKKTYEACSNHCFLKFIYVHVAHTDNLRTGK